MVPTRQEGRSCQQGTARPGEELVARAVDSLESLDALFENALPAFGGAQLRRTWQLLDEAIGRGIPMSLAVAGPVTLSGQAQAWLNPLLETGWFLLVSTTDAVCYHDGHRALDDAREHPIHHVDMYGQDGALRDERTIRVTDIGFSEDVLLEQDRYLRAVLGQEEFQRKMSGTEFRSLLGRRFAAQEKQNGVPEGLLALCWRKAIPVFVGAPADGSVFLNSLELWLRERLGGAAHAFELDLHLEVFESCAFHRWGVKGSGAGAIGTLILGGGVPKNFNLQPEPTLSQIIGLEDVPGYLYDIQITSAPVTDGSLSSCPPAEAVTWGKVDRDSYRSTCSSMQADYTTLMPFLTRALLEKRARFERWAERMGMEALVEAHPEAAGYLRERSGYRLMERRAELVEALLEELRSRPEGTWAPATYPLASLQDPPPTPATESTMDETTPQESDAPEEQELAPYRIELARSSRSRCRTCQRKIQKDTLRLGILLEGPYGTGYLWHHLNCAARRRGEDVEAAFEQRAWDEGLELPPIEKLRQLQEKAKEERAKRKDTPFVERAPTGRSRCKRCEEPIEKGGLRVTLAREVRFGNQVRSTPIKIHARCTAAELASEDCLTETEGFAEQLRRNSTDVEEADVVEALEAIGELE